MSIFKAIYSPALTASVAAIQGKRIIFVPVLLVVGVALSACTDAKSEPDAPPLTAVDVAPVVEKRVRIWDEFNGRISAVNSVEIRPRVTGYIDKVNYREGDEVRRGDLLFTIDQRPYRAALLSASARLAQAQALIFTAKDRKERGASLHKSRVISDEEAVDRSKSYEKAQAEVLEAEAALDLAKLNLAFSEVRAPIDGKVGQAKLTEGNLAVADQTSLTTVVSQDTVYVDFDPDEHSFLRYAAQARETRSSISDLLVKVGLANDDGFPHAAKLSFLNNEVDSATGSIRLRALLENKDRIFTPGLYARVQVARESESMALLVDDKAILTDQDRRFVYTLGFNNTAVRKDVSIGRLVEGLRVVDAGLNSGDKIITSGFQKIYASETPVSPTEVSMTAAINQ
ncbi:efflux RND transporter periplasmic adaptor subunit [Rhizobiaceae bacterium n13]|uniref:Efflux RND transporter periplasmic adaptor subunit n=1 Tax=Ferirhizobium litorale TaxID=2927786 RepID=A0AAE3QEQ7_9HYPH|nr:efflux RND transporter periplasmic adaptor subunit [Fererhizobium litorale]MDI7864669.1 efflux RND transporter periplasmic adaptor subunit [Fererhizobium litorale]MDI7922160.1 efflux RND transporter periplasmic adaptor subunit [Fererhizobium litorale]